MAKAQAMVDMRAMVNRLKSERSSLQVQLEGMGKELEMERAGNDKIVNINSTLQQKTVDDAVIINDLRTENNELFGENCALHEQVKQLLGENRAIREALSDAGLGLESCSLRL